MSLPQELRLDRVLLITLKMLNSLQAPSDRATQGLSPPGSGTQKLSLPSGDSSEARELPELREKHLVAQKVLGKENCVQK